MRIQARHFGEDKVLAVIRAAIEKCAISLGITMTEEAIAVLCYDLFDVYRNDSVEDIIECLKKGRRGVYGFGHNSRSNLNMILIHEWMVKHLEEKSEIREKELSKFKLIDKEPLKDVDYESYKKRVQEKQKEPKRTNANENAYQRYKLKYMTQSQEDQAKQKS